MSFMKLTKCFRKYTNTELVGRRITEITPNVSIYHFLCDDHNVTFSNITRFNYFQICCTGADIPAYIIKVDDHLQLHTYITITYQIS